MSEATHSAAKELAAMAQLALLGAVWGGSFLLMRVAAPEFGPFALVEVRLLFGALVLLPFVYRARNRLAGRWLVLFMIGMIYSAVPFTLLAWSTSVAPAGISAIANSMTALFAVVFAGLMFGERIGFHRALGLASGIIGVVVMVDMPMAGVPIGWAALAATMAAACYGLAGNLVKHHLAGLPAVALGGATLSCSAVMLSPMAIWHWPEQTISTTVWASAITLGVLCTGIAYAFLFRLVESIGPSRTATVTYLVPLFGVAWAWLLLGEPVTPGMMIAGVLVLGGVALSQPRRRSLRAKPDSNHC